MKIKTVIVDDEAPTRRRMKRLLGSNGIFDLIGEAENGEDAIPLINKAKPDFLLLDIELKDITGFEVLSRLSPEINPIIIFITAYDEYAIKAFEASAVDYLLKPYKTERFERALEKVRGLFESNTSPSFQELLRTLKQANSNHIRVLKIPEGKTQHHFQPDKIIYIKSDNYYCNFHMDKEREQKLIRISLKSLEPLLPSDFIRISKSVIINKTRIDSIKSLKKYFEVNMTNGHTLTAYKTFKNITQDIFNL
ncbi:MAG: LytTR family DNA-binding domain-containing protein [Bacteroidota bacterium]